jgi:hypothetical protein
VGGGGEGGVEGAKRQCQKTGLSKNEAANYRSPENNTKRPPNVSKAEQKQSERNTKMGAVSNGPHLGAKTARQRTRKT